MPFATKAIRDRARKRIAQRVRAGQPCCFCHQQIDLRLPYPAPMSFVVDHAVPTSLGGSDDYDGLRPAHARCNVRRSNQPDGTVGRNSGALDPLAEVPSRSAPATSSAYVDQSRAPNSPGAGKESP